MTTQRATHRRLWRMLALVSVAALAAAGCGDDGDDTTTDDNGDDALAEWQENGITIGIAPEPPYGYEEDGEATGEAPELAKEIFGRLDIEITDYTVVDFGALIDGLNAGRMDVISAGMFIDPDRAENVLFANPDYCASTAFAVPEGNPDELTDLQSAAEADITLGVVSGTVEEGYAEDVGADSSTFQNNSDAFAALESGRVDAVALTSFTIVDQTDQMSGFEATEGFIPVIDDEEQLGCGAFAFRFEDEALRNAFNEELAAMQEADEVLPIVEPFGFDEAAVEAAEGVTANELADGAYDDIDG